MAHSNRSSRYTKAIRIVQEEEYAPEKSSDQKRWKKWENPGLCRNFGKNLENFEITMPIDWKCCETDYVFFIFCRKRKGKIFPVT